MKREIVRFEADTQEQAITKGKTHLAAIGGNADAWAFAREGLINENGRKVDGISVGIWAEGSNEPNARTTPRLILSGFMKRKRGCQFPNVDRPAHDHCGVGRNRSDARLFWSDWITLTSI